MEDEEALYDDTTISVRRRSDGMIPKKRRRKSAKRRKVEAEVIKLADVLPNKKIAERLGISVSMVNRILKDYYHELELEFSNNTAVSFAAKAYRNYTQLITEGYRILRRAENIEDQKEKLNMKTKAMERIQKAQEALDKMLKFLGIYQEKSVVYNIDITKTEKWAQLQLAILVYIKYVLKQDPQQFLDFIESVSRNPKLLEEYLSPTTRRKLQSRDYGDVANSIMSEEDQTMMVKIVEDEE